MSVLIKDMEMPKECHGCRWFYFQGTSCTEPKYYLDARCKMVESGQDWYGKDVHGGWIGESIEHIPGWTGYYQYKHCVETGTMASQCPLCELPSAQPEQRYTEEELRVFQHGISLSLLSKRSSQHWQYDEDTATEIKFLERLYEKVGADIRSEHDG